MDRLVSLQSLAGKQNVASPDVSVTRIVQPSSVPSVNDLTKSFAAALTTQNRKHVVLSNADVKQLPRLNGSADVDVNSVLTQFRLIAHFKVKSAYTSSTGVTELERLADNVAFESCSLICDGPILVLYQHLMSGRIDWKAPVVSTEVSDLANSFTPPSNWSELKTALLDCLMPSNCVEESAIRLISFKMQPVETVSAYALRFQSELTRFESSVKRISPNRSPHQALSVILFQNGLPPAIRSPFMSERPAQTIREAVDRARRHEAANLMGNNPNSTVSAMSFTHVPNRTAIAEQFTSTQPRRQSRPVRSGPGSGPSGGQPHVPTDKGKRPARSYGKQRERPQCTHPTCKQ